MNNIPPNNYEPHEDEVNYDTMLDNSELFDRQHEHTGETIADEAIDLEMPRITGGQRASLYLDICTWYYKRYNRIRYLKMAVLSLAIVSSLFLAGIESIIGWVLVNWSALFMVLLYAHLCDLHMREEYTRIDSL